MSAAGHGLPEIFWAFLSAEDPSQACAILSTHPELLGDEVALALEEISFAQQDEATGELLRAHAALLARCREIGIEAALADEINPTAGELRTAIQVMLNAESWPETYEILQAHIELLHPSALASLEATAASAEDALTRIHVLSHCALLSHCREVGFARAFSEGVQWTDAGNPPELQDFVTVAVWLTPRAAQDETAFSWLLETYETILERLGEDQAAFRSVVLTQFGSALHDRRGGDPRDNLLRAIAAYEAAMACLPADAPATERAMILHNLGTAHFNLPASGRERAKNLDRAIALLEESLLSLPLDEEPKERARTLGSLASALAEYPTMDRGPWLERARVLYEAALPLASEASDQEKGAMQHGLGEIYRLRLVSDTGRATAQHFRYSTGAWRYALGDEQRPSASRFPGRPDAPVVPGSAASDLRRSIACYEEARRLLDPDRDPLLFASTLHGLGAVWAALPDGERAANLQIAIARYEEALTRYPKEARLDRAAALTNLGGALSDLPTGVRSENLRRAITCYEEALTMLTPESEPDDYGFVCNNLGYAHATFPLGDREETLRRAIAWYERALGVFTASSAPDEYAMIQSQLGNAYAELPRGDRTANLLRAIGHHEEALRFRTAEVAPFAYASTLNNLGGIYEKLPVGDRATNVQKAVGCYEEALRVFTEDLSPHDYALTQNNLGVALSSLTDGDLHQNLERAVACHREALHFYEPASSPWEYVSTQNNLGVAYRGLAVLGAATNLELAVSSFEEASRYCDRSSVPGLFAMVRNNLGLSYSALSGLRPGEVEARAIACFGDALTVYTPEAEPHDCRLAARNLADLHFARGEWRAAADAYGIALNAGERLYQAGQLGASKAAEVAENALVHRNAAFAATRVESAAQAFLIHERGKARLLSEALRLHVARPEGVPGALWEAFELAGFAVRDNLASEIGSVAPARSVAETSSARLDAVRGAGAALDASIAAIRVIAPGFLREPDLGTLLAALPDDRSALVSICVTARGGVAFVLARGCAEPVSVVELPDLTTSWLDALLLGPAEERGSDPGLPTAWGQGSSWFERALDHALDAVSEVILTPVLAALPQDTERLVLLPSGRLFLLPLHAARIAGGERLDDRFAVSYVPSIAVLAGISERALSTAERSLSVIINPEEDPALSLAPVEGALVSAHFDERARCEGPEATRAAVSRAVLGRSYVHFACHGHYEPTAPTESHLGLSDGRLTLADLRRGELDLRAARVVVLSACETGVVDVGRGVDEYLGLSAGFLLAGVPSVVSSLWPVPDVTATLLMERFYLEHLDGGKDTVAALRQARRWLRELGAAAAAKRIEGWYRGLGRRGDARLLKHLRHLRHLAAEGGEARPFAHPYWWAAFVVSGVSVEPELGHRRR